MGTVLGNRGMPLMHEAEKEACVGGNGVRWVLCSVGAVSFCEKQMVGPAPCHTELWLNFMCDCMV
jgi:hypothetical protein